MNGVKLNNLKFIAEIASTHGGSQLELNKLLKNIVISQSDCLKLQIFKNDDLCHVSSKFYKGLKKIELPFEYWENTINKYKKKFKIIIEPFDKKSYLFSKKFKKDVFIKISASEHDNLWMIKDSIKNFRKVFINISGYQIKEILKLLQGIKNKKKKVVLMYGFQSFPSNPQDLRLKIIKEIVKAGYIAGYADHSDTLNLIGSYLSTSKAVDYGATYIEKHVTFDRSEKKPDYITSLNPKELKDFINFFNKDYLKFKKNQTEISKKEMIYCKVMGKFAVLIKKVKKGERLNKKNIKFLRTGSKGITRLEYQKLIKSKKKFCRNLKNNTVLKKNHIK